MEERIFDKFFEKIKFITKKNTSQDIAKILGIASSTFSEKKYRDQIPYEQVVKFCEKYDVDIVWLLDLKNSQQSTYEQIKDINNTKAQKLIEEIKNLVNE